MFSLILHFRFIFKITLVMIGSILEQIGFLQESTNTGAQDVINEPRRKTCAFS